MKRTSLGLAALMLGGGVSLARMSDAEMPRPKRPHVVTEPKPLPPSTDTRQQRRARERALLKRQP